MPFTEPPVTFIESDRNEPRAPEPGIALCLSGCGYRAMLFHLGAVRRLNELGYLGKLRRVSSVSGGSITAGVLAMNWSRLRVTTGVADNFEEEITQPIRKLAGITVDGWSIVGGLALPGSINDKVTAAYRKHVFGARTLRDIPADDERPALRLQRDECPDWRHNALFAAVCSRLSRRAACQPCRRLGSGCSSFFGVPALLVTRAS